MNKRLLYSGGLVLLVILFVTYYYTRTSDVRLAKFNKDAMTFDNSPGIEEGTKMTSPEMLKNTIMSLVPLNVVVPPSSSVIGKTTEAVVVPNLLISDNGEYKLVMQEDANLMIISKDGNFVWGTANANDMQGGKLSGWVYKKGPYRIILQEDGNLLVYGTEVKDDNTLVWSVSGTKGTNFYEKPTGVENGPYKLGLENDGRLLIYDKNNNIVWSNVGNLTKPPKVREGLFFIKINGEFITGMKSQGDSLVNYRTDEYQVRDSADESCCGDNVWTRAESSCSNGTYVTSFFGDTGRYIDRIGIICQDGTQLGPHGGGDNDGLYSVESINGFNKMKFGYGSMVDNFVVSLNNDFERKINGEGANHTSICSNGKIIGIIPRYSGSLHKLSIICGKNIKVSVDAARNEFASTNSSITNYKNEYPVPFFLEYKNNYDFNLYDIRGKTYNLSQYTNLGKVQFEINDRNIHMKQDGEYFNTSRSYIIKDKNAGGLIELVPVLDPEKLAPKYLQASIKYFNTSSTNREQLKQFCGSNVKFPDGTLKIYPSSMQDKDTGLITDRIGRAFESICACNMDGKFYIDLFCNDELIKKNFGIDPADPKNRELVTSIRGTMKCTYPTCTFEKCKNIMTKEDRGYVYNQKCLDNIACGDCGSSTLCITNQNINIGEGATLQDTTINADTMTKCGIDTKVIPKMTESGNFMWLDDVKIKLGKEQKCFVEKEGKQVEVDSSASGCSAVSSKVFLDFEKAMKASDTTNPDTKLRTITLRGVLKKVGSTVEIDFNEIKELIYNKYKDEFNLPDITAVDVNMQGVGLVITSFASEPTPEPTPEPTSEKKSYTIYIVILILLLLCIGGYIVIGKKR